MSRELRESSRGVADREGAEVNLHPSGADVWIAEVPPENSIPGPLGRSLSREEADQAARFHRARHRHEYRFAHTVLRDVLSRYLGVDAARVEFRRNRYGKPFLQASASELEFNMSHSGSLVIVGVALRRGIGVDVERIRPLPDLEALAAHNFTAAERQLLVGAPDSRLRAFFTCWTRKEAYIKAIGTGLSTPLDSFDTSIPLDAPGRAAGSCWLTDLTVPAGYTGAMAVERGLEHLRYWDWRSRSAGA